LLPYQLCLHKGWKKPQHTLTKPMVFLYVPLRVVAIPICTLLYYTHLKALETYLQVYCIMLFGLLNCFSMFYGVVIAYKYSLYLKKSMAK
jgi:hypothetical protein